jgi:hypothetical protein
VASAQRVGGTGSFFELMQQLTASFFQELCRKVPPQSYAGTFAGSHHTSGAAQDTTETWRATGVVFDRNPASPDTQPWYDLKAGTVEYSISGRYLVQCQISAHATVSLDPASGASGQVVYTARGSYTAQAGPGAPITATVTCPESEPTTTNWWLYQTLLATNPSGGEQTPDPSGVLSGSSNLPEPGGSAEWSWTLSPRG